jgi:glutathione S-transferase
MTVDDTPPKANPPVYRLHLFPPTPYCYNISPFAIKLESFLRINKIDYECVYTSKFGSKGQIPYVKIGNEELCDSNVIIRYLQNHCETTDASTTTPQERATTHATIRMLEEHTAQIGFHYRYGLQMPAFHEKLDLGKRLFEADKSTKGSMISKAFLMGAPASTLKKSKARNLLRHSEAEIWQFSCDDLQALSILLGDGPYFFGKASPTLLDCAVFGHLSQFLYIPIDFPQARYMKDECPNLVAFVERFRESYWPDWESKCERQRNSKYVDLENKKKAEKSSGKGRRGLPLSVAATASIVVLAFAYNRWVR